MIKKWDRYSKNVEFGWTKVSEKKKMAQGKQKWTKRMLWKMVGEWEMVGLGADGIEKG